MKFLLSLLCLALLAVGSARADEAQPGIVGQWLFYKKVYGGNDLLEPPSATLRLHFDFDENGESHLYWWHEGERDHCSRRARYSVEEGPTLVEEVTWVDPANTIDCGSDPDMTLGRKTRTPISFPNGDLAIRFHIAGEPLDMVFKRSDAK